MADKKPQKSAGRSAGTGNVTIDLGEAIDKKLRSAGMAGRGALTRPQYRPGGHRPGGLYRPGMYGGYRPWYASQFGGGRLGLGAVLGLPESVNTTKMLTGALLGIAGNRALVRVTPELISTGSKLVHEAIAFGVGIIPLLVKRNDMTVGVALPGLVFFGGSIADWALDAVGVRRPALQGAGVPRAGHDAALAARERLAAMRSRVVPGSLPRVVAQPTHA